MQTCKDWIFKEIYKNQQLTKSARILFIYLLAHCDESGTIAIYHADIEKIIGINVKTFYKSLKCLEQTKTTYKLPDGRTVTAPLIIRENKTSKSDITITIPNNSFVKKYHGESKRFCNYVDLDFECLKAINLNKLSHAELRVMLYFFFRASKHGRAVDYTAFKSKGKAYISISNQLGLCVQAVRKAISRLIKKCAISFNRTNDIIDDPLLTSEGLNKNQVVYNLDTQEIFVTVKSSTGVDDLSHEKHFRSDRHTVRTILRNSNRKWWTNTVQEQEINDISVLLNQYRNKAKSKGKAIENVIKEAITKCTVITASIVHSCIRSILAL